MKIINNISTKLYRVHKFLKSKFCRLEISKNDKYEYCYQKEERILFMYYTIVILLLKTIYYIFSFGVTFQSLCYFTLFIGLTLFFLYLKKLFVIKCILFFLCTLAPLAEYSFTIHSETLMLAPLLGTIMPILCLVTTKSCYTTIICFLANVFTTVCIYKKHFLFVLENSSTQMKKEMIDKMVFSSINYSICTCVMITILFYSNKKLIERLIDKKIRLEFSNTKTLETNAQLQESVQSKTNFLLNTSQGLKNSLNSVLYFLELASNSVNNDQIQENIQNAQVNGEILHFSLNNLLDCVKIEENMLEISKVPTNMTQYFEALWITASTFITQNKLQGELRVAKGVPKTLQIDPQRIMQIVLNLISNATKNTKKGSIRILISWLNEDKFKPEMMKSNGNPSLEKRKVEEVDEEFFNEYNDVPQKIVSYTLNQNFMPNILRLTTLQTGYLRKNSNVSLKSTISKLAVPTSKEGFLKIEVVDTGSGISNSDFQILFQKYHQTFNQVGAGLGLWISKNICETMGGNIKSHSKLGEGSSFVFVIKSEILLEPFSIDHGLGIGASRNLKTHLQAMIIDDVKLNQDIMKEFLGICEVKVTDIASNGLEAYEKFKARDKGHFDIIFMDLEMPVLNGKEAAKLIRAFEKENAWHPVTIVVITGNCYQSVFTECLNPKGEFKANFVFPKPLTLKDCKNFIEKFSSQKSLDPSSLMVKDMIKKSGNMKKIILIDNTFNDKNLKELDDIARNKCATLMKIQNLEVIDNLLKQMDEKIIAVFINCDWAELNISEVCKRIRDMCKTMGIQDLIVYGLTSRRYYLTELQKKYRIDGMKTIFCEPYDFSII